MPGPPTADLAAELALLADLESTGGAQRLPDHRGVGAARARRRPQRRRAWLRLIAQRSRTPVPQALQYLVDDLARRHGALRTGAATAYLRCDDESLLTRVLTDRNVAVAPAAPHRADRGRLDVRGRAGARGAARSRLRARRPRTRTARWSRSTPNRRARRRVRRRGRSGRPARPTRPGSPNWCSGCAPATRSPNSRARTPAVAQQIPGVTSAATMGTLRAAIREGRRVLLGLAEADGVAARHTIAPISMAGGFVRGHEPGVDGLRAFPLHRITAVTVLSEPDADQ